MRSFSAMRSRPAASPSRRRSFQRPRGSRRYALMLSMSRMGTRPYSLEDGLQAARPFLAGRGRATACHRDRGRRRVSGTAAGDGRLAGRMHGAHRPIRWRAPLRRPAGRHRRPDEGRTTHRREGAGPPGRCVDGAGPGARVGGRGPSRRRAGRGRPHGRDVAAAAHRDCRGRGPLHEHQRRRVSRLSDQLSFAANPGHRRTPVARQGPARRQATRRARRLRTRAARMRRDGDGNHDCRSQRRLHAQCERDGVELRPCLPPLVVATANRLSTLRAGKDVSGP